MQNIYHFIRLPLFFPWILVLAFCCLNLTSANAGPTADNQDPLLTAVDLALRQSDTALDLRDTLSLSGMEAASARHQFTTRLIPLTNIGIVQGTGSQKLGLEARRAMSSGAQVAYGLVTNRLDDNGDYVVENPVNAQAYIRLSQGILRRWGSDYNLTEVNVATLKEQEELIRAERARQTLIYETVQKYYQLVLSDQLLIKSLKAEARSGENLEAARSRQAVGLVSKADVYRAELALLDAESAVQNQQRQNRRAREALEDLLRWQGEEVFPVADSVSRMVPVVPEDWRESLYDARLDWQVHLLSVKRLEMELLKAERNLLPDLGLSMTLAQRGAGDTFGEASALDETNWSVQLEMLSPLDTFDEDQALLRKQLEKNRLARAEVALKRKIEREAVEALDDLVMEENNYQRSLRRSEQAAMALELAKTRYERGLIDNLEVLEAESAFSEAELGISRDLTAYNLAAVALSLSLGTLDRGWLEMSLASDTVPVAAMVQQ